MTGPESLDGEDGKWYRRDELVDECADDFDTDPEVIEESLDEMLTDDNPFWHSKTIDGDEYVQINDFTKAISFVAKGKTKNLKDRARELFRL